MKWQFYHAGSAFEEFCNEWDVLNRAQNNNHILLDSRFVVPLVKHFGSPETVLAVSSDGPRSGLALLCRTATGSWSTFQPSQSPLGLIILSGRDENCEFTFSLMRALPGYTVQLSILQQDPLYSAFEPASERSDVEILDYMETPCLRISCSFDDYWSQRSKNLRHNLERQSRRAREQSICFELQTLTRRDEMAQGVSEYGRLESAGWKSDGGTAIHEGNGQGRFYREILENFSESNEAIVYQLRLNGQIVASDLCLRRDGMLVVLKTTYDETINKYSPALLMRREITRQICSEGDIRVVEFYGRLRDWHKQWMTDVRTMFHVNAFRSSYVSRARKILKRFR